MPVRSLTSSVMKWPDRDTVDRALRQWAEQLVTQEPAVRQVGYIGSYARGDWGVGSDVDIIVVVAHTTRPFERRSLSWDTAMLPVPADILVYTLDEWQALQAQDSRFARTVAREAQWVYCR
jgi:uncharacterized protein